MRRLLHFLIGLLVTGCAGLFLPASAASPASAPPAGKAHVDEALRKELVAMGREDQLGTFEADAHTPGTPAPLAIGDAGPRVARLKAIVAQHGWPGRSLVGEDGAHAAWLIAQHADFDPAFQRDCLDRMRLAFAQGEVTPQELSFLTDRVSEKEGKPQMYGTQGTFGSPSPEEEARIDANRAALGLEPWRVFIEERRKNHGPWQPAQGAPAAASRPPA